jgi:hypothetical protein
LTYVTQRNYRINLSEASPTLHLSTEELQRALDALSDKGVIGTKSPKKSKTPNVVIETAEEESSGSIGLHSLSASVKPSLYHGAIVGGVAGLVTFLILFLYLYIGKEYSKTLAVLFALLIAAAVATVIGVVVGLSYRNKKA